MNRTVRKIDTFSLITYSNKIFCRNSTHQSTDREATAFDRRVEQVSSFYIFYIEFTKKASIDFNLPKIKTNTNYCN